MGASWSLWGLFGGRTKEGRRSRPVAKAAGQPVPPPVPHDEGVLLERRLGGHEDDDTESILLLTDEELEAEEWRD